MKINYVVQLPYDILASMKSVEKKLGEFDTQDFIEKELAIPAVHLLSGSGKLIRPALILASAKAIGRKPSEFVDLAVAIELLHTSSLLHDDLIDRDSVRRGLESVHEKYGSEAAIIAGDALISKAVEESCKYGTGIVEYVARSAMKMCAGEMLDYNCQKQRKIPDLKTYLKIAELKSGALMEISASAAAKHSENRHFKDLAAFGRYLGIGFQIRDDVLDYLGLDMKSIGNDSKKFRPNVIETLIKQEKLDKKSAVKEAVRLNRHYIDIANRKIRGNAFVDMRTYAEGIKFKRVEELS